MENIQNNIFERIEKKYRLSESEYRELRGRLEDRLEPDKFCSASIMSLYFDTVDDHLIGRSLEKPMIYKEKLRIRSYGVPEEDSPVFAELKKKFKGVVYKRRISLSWEEARDWLILGGAAPKDDQISREIQYFMDHYSPSPAALICYDREAFHGAEDSSLRVTFDSGIRGRSTALDLTNGSWGSEILGPGEHLMEIKANGAYPLWLCEILAELELYSSSFSKYGAFYEERRSKKVPVTGGVQIAGKSA